MILGWFSEERFKILLFLKISMREKVLNNRTAAKRQARQ